ncbi:hypothetical protein G7Y89_g7013 [Cudoniella acicularis]|uniref:Cytochrome P450 n=1 Tax=Cudoniella acicularis TaxID=354080 RepID=A0A8H4RJC8_9HELO|nr:hypothetical protein G7Y89_g7013 [Cudoniella acicularis]
MAPSLEASLDFLPHLDLSRVQPYLPKDVYLGAAAAVVGISMLYVLGLVIHRLVFSPIARFPGPKIAAVTSWYEFYYDVVKNGRYLFEIERMHEKYGPIVRINPYELSIRDSEYYDKLYVAGSVRQTDNYEIFASGRFGSFKGTKQVVRLDHAFLAFSGDVISRLCIDDPPNFVDDPNFAPEWFELFHTVIKSLPLFMGLPWLIQLIRLIPESILMWLDPRSQNFNKFKLMSEGHISAAKREKAALGNKDTSTMGGRITLFRHLVNSDLPPSELSEERLSKEAQVLLGAGTVSTARTLDFICYYIMANPAIRKRLTEELKDIMEGYPEKKPTWAQLEKLVYMQALIKEGLRLSYGVMHRLPRVSPKQPIQFKQWSIPAGVPVSMSAYFQHTLPHIFPRPLEFVPERWLDNVTPEMNRNYVPFSKGSRNCLGMNLATCELNFILSALFRPGGPDFNLYETDESDVTQAHDLMLPLPKMDTKGIRVIFH